MQKEIVAIGDTHGCSQLLSRLLEKIHDSWEWKQLVFLGDYIDRGPDVPGVVEQIIQLQQQYPGNVIALLGNHEHWMLEALEDPKSLGWLLGMNGFQTIYAYDPSLAEELKNLTKPSLVLRSETPIPYEKFFYHTMPTSHLQFFQNLRPYYWFSDVIFVHAGIRPGIPLEEQDMNDLVWITEDFYENYQGKEWVIFGHYGTDFLRNDRKPLPFIGKNRIIGIDTGSARTGVLTAYSWPDRDSLSVHQKD